jgi:DNA polymerase IV
VKYILHVDFNSFFATVEQQANPRLRRKPIGVTGGDRLTRTVIGAASVEAKARGVYTGMKIPEALKLCPDLILVRGDSDKYLEINKKFLNILKGYTDKMEVFSIDEVFLEVDSCGITGPVNSQPQKWLRSQARSRQFLGRPDSLPPVNIHKSLFSLALNIKERIKKEAGEWITCSIGISYNKMLAKLAGSLYKPDGLVGIFDRQSAMWILDRVELDDVCGIGHRIKNRLNNMGVFNFRDLREVPLQSLLASFKSYGKVLYDFARGEDSRQVIPFFKKEEVKSIGHRHTINRDVSDPLEIKQILLKLCELVARRARAKKLEGRTVSFWYRRAFDKDPARTSVWDILPSARGTLPSADAERKAYFEETGNQFFGAGMQTTIPDTDDGLDIFKASWGCFMKLWDGKPVRMVGVSLSNLKKINPKNLTFLEDLKRREVITRALDKINDRYGEFTLQRGVLLNSRNIRRMANSFMSDRRFKI